MWTCQNYKQRKRVHLNANVHKHSHTCMNRPYWDALKIINSLSHHRLSIWCRLCRYRPTKSRYLTFSSNQQTFLDRCNLEKTMYTFLRVQFPWDILQITIDFAGIDKAYWMLLVVSRFLHTHTLTVHFHFLSNLPRSNHQELPRSCEYLPCLWLLIFHCDWKL